MAKASTKKSVASKPKKSVKAQDQGPKPCHPDHPDWDECCKLLLAAIGKAHVLKKDIDEYADEHWSEHFPDCADSADFFDKIFKSTTLIKEMVKDGKIIKHDEKRE
jgi:hypothetical protein